ncbi:hypothetical protein MDAP_001015 [Mitosporidium daphniae]
MNIQKILFLVILITFFALSSLQVEEDDLNVTIEVPEKGKEVVEKVLGPGEESEEEKEVSEEEKKEVSEEEKEVSEEEKKEVSGPEEDGEKVSGPEEDREKVSGPGEDGEKVRGPGEESEEEKVPGPEEDREKADAQNLSEKVEAQLIENAQKLAEERATKAQQILEKVKSILELEEILRNGKTDEAQPEETKKLFEVKTQVNELNVLAKKVKNQANELNKLVEETRKKETPDLEAKIQNLITMSEGLGKEAENLDKEAENLDKEAENLTLNLKILVENVKIRAAEEQKRAKQAEDLLVKAKNLFQNVKKTENLGEAKDLTQEVHQNLDEVKKIAEKVIPQKVLAVASRLQKLAEQFKIQANELQKKAKNEKSQDMVTFLQNLQTFLQNLAQNIQNEANSAQKMAEETRAKALEILVQTVHFKAETVQIPLVKAQTQVEQARNTENLFYGYKLAEKAMKKAHKAYKLASECINYANEAKELAKDVENEKAQNEAKKVQVDAFDSIASTIYAEGIKKAENLVKLAKETKTSIFSIPAFTTQQLGLYALTGDVIHKTGRLQNLFKQFQPEGNEVKKPSKAQTYKLKALNQDAQRLVKKAKHQAIDKVETQASKTQKIVQRAQYLVQIISERINDEKGILLEEKETYDLLKDVKSNAKNLNALAEEVKGQADVLKKLAQNFEKEGAQNLEAAIQYLITISKDLDTKAEDLAKKTIDLETLTTNPKIKKYISKSLESLKNLNCVKTELLTKLMIPKLLSINRVKQAKNEVQEAKSKKQEAEKEAHEAESKKQQAEKEAHEAESKKEGKNKQANTANNQFKKIHEKAQNLEQAMKKAENLKNIVENLIAKLEKFYQAKEKAENARKAAKYEAEEDAKQAEKEFKEAEKEFKEAKLLIPTLKWRFYNIFRDKLKNLKDLDVLVNQKFKKAEEEFKKAEQESKKAEQESKKAQKEVDDAQKKVDDAQKKVDDAQEKVKEAQEKVDDAQQELKEANDESSRVEAAEEVEKDAKTQKPQKNVNGLKSLVCQKIDNEITKLENEAKEAFKKYNRELRKLLDATFKVQGHIKGNFIFLIFRSMIKKTADKKFAKAQKEVNEATNNGLTAQAQLNQVICELRGEIQKLEDTLTLKLEAATQQNAIGRQSSLSSSLNSLKDLSKSFKTFIKPIENENERRNEQYKQYLKVQNAQTKADEAKKNLEAEMTNGNSKHGFSKDHLGTLKNQFDTNQKAVYALLLKLTPDKEYFATIKKMISGICYQILSIFMMWALSSILYFVLFSTFGYRNLLIPVINYLSKYLPLFKRDIRAEQFYESVMSELDQEKYRSLRTLVEVCSYSIGFILTFKPNVATKYQSQEFTWKISPVINFFLSYFGFLTVTELVGEKHLISYVEQFFGYECIKSDTLKPSSDFLYNPGDCIFDVGPFLKDLFGLSKPENASNLFIQFFTFIYFCFAVLHYGLIMFSICFGVILSQNFVSEAILSVLFFLAYLLSFEIMEIIF